MLRWVTTPSDFIPPVLHLSHCLWIKRKTFLDQKSESCHKIWNVHITPDTLSCLSSEFRCDRCVRWVVWAVLSYRLLLSPPWIYHTPNCLQLLVFVQLWVVLYSTDVLWYRHFIVNTFFLFFQSLLQIQIQLNSIWLVYFEEAYRFGIYKCSLNVLFLCGTSNTLPRPPRS